RSTTHAARCGRAPLRFEGAQSAPRAEPTPAPPARPPQSLECPALAVLLPKFLPIDRVRRDCGGRAPLPDGDAAQRGSVVDPIKNLSTACAASRPSRIAHTTSDWPRRMSPAANTFGLEL